MENRFCIVSEWNACGVHFTQKEKLRENRSMFSVAFYYFKIPQRAKTFCDFSLCLFSFFLFGCVDVELNLR